MEAAAFISKDKNWGCVQARGVAEKVPVPDSKPGWVRRRLVIPDLLEPQIIVVRGSRYAPSLRVVEVL